MAAEGQGNPAVVGLAGFGLTTLILQFHNLGWCGIGPVLALAFAFGGVAQLIAGFQEFKCGNNFGYSAFVSYGSFWIALGIIWMLNHFKVYTLSHTDVGFFLVVWTLYTAIMWVGCHAHPRRYGLDVHPVADWFYRSRSGPFRVPRIDQTDRRRSDSVCAERLVHDGRRHLCAGVRKADSPRRETVDRLCT
jgi:hypothetical protein